MTAIASPCVNVCRMDADGELCVGCFRTLDEIAQWSRAADATRLAILAAVDKRRAACSESAMPPPAVSHE